MAIKEKLKKAGITVGAIAASGAAEAGIATAEMTGQTLPIVTGAVLGGAGGVIAAREIIHQLKIEENKCIKSFMDWRDMKTLANAYSHECKRHVYKETAKEEAEAAAKIFLMSPAETSFDPCKELKEVNQEVADREAAWRKECSCGKLGGVV
jgi:hypothetical protein